MSDENDWDMQHAEETARRQADAERCVNEIAERQRQADAESKRIRDEHRANDLVKNNRIPGLLDDLDVHNLYEIKKAEKNMWDLLSTNKSTTTSSNLPSFGTSSSIRKSPSNSGQIISSLIGVGIAACVGFYVVTASSQLKDTNQAENKPSTMAKLLRHIGASQHKDARQKEVYASPAFLEVFEQFKNSNPDPKEALKNAKFAFIQKNLSTFGEKFEAPGIKVLSEEQKQDFRDAGAPGLARDRVVHALYDGKIDGQPNPQTLYALARLTDNMKPYIFDTPEGTVIPTWNKLAVEQHKATIKDQDLDDLVVLSYQAAKLAIKKQTEEQKTAQPDPTPEAPKKDAKASAAARTTPNP